MIRHAIELTQGFLWFLGVKQFCLLNLKIKNHEQCTNQTSKVSFFTNNWILDFLHCSLKSDLYICNNEDIHRNIRNMYLAIRNTWPAFDYIICVVIRRQSIWRKKRLVLSTNAVIDKTFISEEEMLKIKTDIYIIQPQLVFVLLLYNLIYHLRVIYRQNRPNRSHNSQSVISRALPCWCWAENFRVKVILQLKKYITAYVGVYKYWNID